MKIVGSIIYWVVLYPLLGGVLEDTGVITSLAWASFYGAMAMLVYTMYLYLASD
jgi:hypothetical protein